MRVNSGGGGGRCTYKNIVRGNKNNSLDKTLRVYMYVVKQKSGMSHPFYIYLRYFLDQEGHRPQAQIGNDRHLTCVTRTTCIIGSDFN